MKATVSTLATLLVLAVGGSTAQAAINLYWDANGAGSGTGGTGPWNTTDLTWRAVNHIGALQAWVNGNNVFFINATVYYVTPATITLETDITVGTLNFQNDHYTINGPFTLTSDASVSGVGTTVTGEARASGTINVPVIMKGGDIDYRHNVTFNNTIADDGGNRKLKHYFNTLTLNASNVFTRGVELMDASANLVIGHDHALGTGTLIVFSGSKLDAGGGDRTVTNDFSMAYNGLLTLRGTNDLTFTAPLVLRANGGYPRFSVAEPDTVLTFNSDLLQQIHIDGGMIKEGPGTFVINGTYRADWHTVVTNGTLLLNGTTIAPLNNYSCRVWSGATLGGTGIVNLAASGSTCTVYRAGALAPGTQRAGSRVGTFRINGPVSLAEHSIYKWDCQDGAGDLLNVNGRLSLPAVATVVVSRISGELPESSTLMTANSLAGPGAGDVSGWVVLGERGVRLTVADNTVVIERFQPGTLIEIR